MGTTTVQTMFGAFVSEIASNLTNNLPVILVVAAGLIGLGILIHYVRKWIGRK